ncbi:unnamed protein product [Cuscuta epithymum]|uniref:Pectinesterase inhibitor domain-containing protein n=1 Tax=Cuscuta epithymum TaxID=186058 RepID=A0AAV0EXY7_9ASTE|nr:unnamed protein product [Cuscuta epithymum]
MGAGAMRSKSALPCPLQWSYCSINKADEAGGQNKKSVPYPPNSFNSTKNIMALPLFFLLCLLIMNANGGVTALDLINKTCKAIASADPINIQYGFCASSLHGAPASECATLRGLATIDIRLIRYNLTDTRCYIKHLLKTNRGGGRLRMCLADCLDMYAGAIPDAKQAMKDFNSRRFADANTRLSAVMDAATTCEDGFSEFNGVVSPLTKRNNDTFQLTAIALSLLKIIQTGAP